MKKIIKNQGFAAIIAVIIVCAMGLVIASSLLLLGLGSTRSSFSRTQSDQAKGLADACLESALQEIRNNTSYSGTSGLTLGQGSCTFTVAIQSGENRTIIAAGTVGNTVRKVRATLSQINPTITIVSWQEVADF